jgi:hypothetical protein
VQFGEDVELVRAVEVYVLLIVVGQPCCCASPEIVPRAGRELADTLKHLKSATSHSWHSGLGHC